MQVKSTVREIAQPDAVRIFDDTIQEKPWTDESELICWHFDHCQNRTVKGMNLLNAFDDSGEVSIPVDFRLIRKPLPFCDVATRRLKRASEVTKNELLQKRFLQALQNQLTFRDVFMDRWFAAKDNFALILSKHKPFVAVLKDNRLMALSQADQEQVRFVRVDSLPLADKQVVRGWLKGFEHDVLLIGRVFTNKDGCTGRLSLVCSDLTCDGEPECRVCARDTRRVDPSPPGLAQWRQPVPPGFVPLWAAAPPRGAPSGRARAAHGPTRMT